MVDPSKPGLEGRAEIAIALDRPRRTIWLHGLGLDVREVSVEPAGGAPIPGRWTGVNPDGLARVDLPSDVGPGPAVLRVAWAAPYGKSTGCFTVAAAGERYAITQLEAPYARRAFPAFDEPRFKTPYDVTLTVPAALVAVSNAPETGSEPVDGGRRRVRFATTPPISSYLVFWGVGPFDVVTPPPLPPNEVRARPLPVRYLAPRGRGKELAFAIEASAELVPALERYFGIPFPYEKLDQLAAPDVGWAMENAGAILYGDRNLLFDPATRPADARRSIANVLTHEVSHQWFGDDVTLGWWTDVWLNESFATWITERIVSRWRPAWGADLEALGAAIGAMDLDGLATARAVRKPLERMADVEGQFDSLSYQKGQAVLAMFERFAGEAPFREGVRAYLRAHAGGTGSTPDFFAAVSRAAGRDLAGPLSTFLDQPGVPLVEARVACAKGGASVALRQSRWVPRGSTAARDARWSIPVCVRYAVKGAAHEACTLLDQAEGALAFPEGCPDWILPDAGAAGYYRWSLPPEDLRRLRDRGLRRLSPAERLSFADAVRSARRAGALSWADAMDALAPLAADPVPEVAAAPMQELAAARRSLLPPDAWPALAATARRLYRPALARLGWTPRPGEPPTAGALRAQVVGFLAMDARDPAVRREAARRGRAWLGLAPGGAAAVAPELVAPCLGVAVQEGGAAAFDAVLARLSTEEDGAVRRWLLLALADADDPALAERATGIWRDPRVRTMERPIVIATQAQRPERRDAALAALERDLDALAAALPDRWHGYLPYLFQPLCDDAGAARVDAIFQPRLAAWPDARKALAETTEAIRLCAAARAADAGPARAWLDARAGLRPAVTGAGAPRAP